MYGIGEVIIPATESYGFTIAVPLEMAHYFQKGRNVREVKESMSSTIPTFYQTSCYESIKRTLNCAFSCNAYFNGMYEEDNLLKVNLNFPTCERMWNFAVQFVSLA